MFLPRNAGITSGRASRRTLFPSGVLSQVYDARRAGSAQPEGRRPRATTTCRKSKLSTKAAAFETRFLPHT
jgi:hypothetical protein